MGSNTCYAGECNRPVSARGLCGGHYSRWSKHGECFDQGPIRETRPPGTVCEVGHCNSPNSSSGFCAKHAARNRRHGDPLAGKPPIKSSPSTPEARILKDIRMAYREPSSAIDASVIPLMKAYCGASSDEECWIWPSTTKSGYGRMNLNYGKAMRTHRLAVEFRSGYHTPLLPSEIVHHICATRACCNPKHLQVVDARDNLAESLERKYYKDRIKALEEEVSRLSEGCAL